MARRGGKGGLVEKHGEKLPAVSGNPGKRNCCCDCEDFHYAWPGAQMLTNVGCSLS